MGAQNIIRTLIEAGLQKYEWDIGASNNLTLLPVLDNTHRFEIGNGTKDASLKIFLGGPNTYALFDRATSTFELSNVTFNMGGDINTNTVTCNTLVVSGTLWANTADVVCNGFTATTGVFTTLNATTLNVTTLTGTNVNSTNMTVSGTLTAGTLTATTLNATTLNATNVVVSGTLDLNALSCQSLSCIPSVDDTGVFVIGNATLGLDFVWTAGSAKTVRFNRGTQQVDFVGVPLTSDSAVTINAAVTSNNTVTSVDLNTTNNTTISNTLIAESMAIIPPSDNQTALTVGNGVVDGDVIVYLGSGTTYFKLDRSQQRLELRGVELNTDSNIVVNAAIITDQDLVVDVVNAAGMKLTGALTPTGDGRINSKYFTYAGNRTLNTHDYGAFIRMTAVATLTLPNPTGLDGVWFEITNYSAATITMQCVNATSNLMAAIGNNAANTVAIDTFGETVRITNLGDRWLVSPYEGTTMVVA